MWSPRRVFAVLLAVALPLMLGSCHDVTGPGWDGSPVVTDSLTYTLTRVAGGYEGTARGVYVNRTGHTVYYARCMPGSGPMFTVEREPPDATPIFFGWAWACVGGVPTGAVSPGDSLVVTLLLGGSDSPNANPPITMAERTGNFRLILFLCRAYNADSDLCDAVPATQARSNVFRVLPPDILLD